MSAPNHQPEATGLESRASWRLAAAAWRLLRRAFLAVLLLELCCALVVTVMNYAIYGKSREGSRIVYDPYTLYTSASGPRETIPGEATGTPRKDRLIWFFGGSTLRGEDTGVAETLPSILVRELNREGTYACRAVNFGVNSFNTLQEVQLLQKAQVENTQWPDLIVFLDGANDASYCIMTRDRNGHEGFARVKGFIESYWSSPLGILKPVMAAAYASFTWELYARLTYALVPVGADLPLLPALASSVCARYDYVDRTARDMGAGFVAFLQPVAWVEPEVQKIPETSLAHRLGLLPLMRTNFSNVYGALERALADRAYFVNLRGVFVGRDFTAYRPDGIHNTDRGREMLAQAMLPAIRQALARQALARPGRGLGRSGGGK